MFNGPIFFYSMSIGKEYDTYYIILNLFICALIDSLVLLYNGHFNDVRFLIQ